VTARWYAAALVLGVAAGALVVWQLSTAASTDCFRTSTELAANGTGTIDGCDRNAAAAVRKYLSERTAMDVADEPSLLEARAAFVIWLALFAGMAVLAAAVGIRSASVIVELRPRSGVRLVLLCLGAAAMVGLPFLLFRKAPDVLAEDFGPFDRLHRPELTWLPPLIGFLLLPAVVGLVVIGRALADRPTFGLDELAFLGSRMRLLLGMLGATLALAVVTTAARWQAIGAMPGGEPVPGTVILLWGAAFALVLAALYLPVHHLWAASAEREIAAEVRRQLPDTEQEGTAGFRGPELALKKELSATLGVGSAFGSLQGSVSLLAPVIAAAVSSLFS
jgi:hypothetical protein